MPKHVKNFGFSHVNLGQFSQTGPLFLQPTHAARAADKAPSGFSVALVP